jgi:hypothetical protein
MPLTAFRKLLEWRAVSGALAKKLMQNEAIKYIGKKELGWWSFIP